MDLIQELGNFFWIGRGLKRIWVIFSLFSGNRQETGEAGEMEEVGEKLSGQEQGMGRLGGRGMGSGERVGRWSRPYRAGGRGRIFRSRGWVLYCSGWEAGYTHAARGERRKGR